MWRRAVALRRHMEAQVPIQQVVCEDQIDGFLAVIIGVQHLVEFAAAWAAGSSSSGGGRAFWGGGGGGMRVFTGGGGGRMRVFTGGGSGWSGTN